MKPNDVFVYLKHNRFIPDSLSLSQCYQPILGLQASQVYQYFLAFWDNGAQKHGLHEILNHLNINMQDLEKALECLMALRLIGIYQSENGLVIKLLPPLTTEEFLDQSIYRKLLEDRIGDLAVERLLVAKPSGKHLEVKLSQVFGLQEEISLRLEKGQPDFDLASFKKMMARENLRFADETKDSLSLFALAEYKGWTWYETFVLAKETAVGQVISTKRMQAQLESVKVAPERTFSSKEMAIIQTAKTQQPLAFLAQIKQARKGMILAYERKALEAMAQLGLLDEVINIIILYSVRQKTSVNLNERYALKVANDFSNQGIQTAEAAVLKIRNLAQQSQQSKAGQEASKTNVPDWSQPDYQNETSLEKQAQLEEQKRRLLAKLDGGD